MDILHHHPGAGWSIRKGRGRDLTAMLRIFRDCLTRFPWRRNIQAQKRDLVQACSSHTVFVAEEPSAGLVGFMLVDLSNSYVSHLFVDPDWQLCGIGRGLLDIARGRVQGPLALDVDVENAAGRAAYAALGWQVAVSTRKNGKRTHIRLISP